MTESVPGSHEVAAAAIKLAVSNDRNEESQLKQQYAARGIRSVAVDFGGEFIPSINKIIERAVLVSKRDGVIGESHSEEGSVAGAAREAVAQILQKAVGLNVGGKIAVARCNEHVSVAVFFGICMMNLNEVGIGLGHRVI